MTNKDIDKQTAEKVMGWDYMKDDGGKPFGYYRKNCNPIVIEINEWQPSTNIAHTWQVIEKMTNDTLRFRITAVHGRGHEVTIFKAGLGKRTKHSLKDELVTEFESTAPLAICKAALKAIEGRK